MNPVITEAGVYTLTVENTATGCVSSDEVTVDASQESPIPFITLQPVSCFGFNDGAILVDSVAGGVPPYMYSLNDEPFVSNGQFLNLPPDTYSLTIEDANGCQSQILTIDIEQPQELNVDLIAIIEAGNSIRLGDSVELIAVTNIPQDEIDSIAWSPPGLLTCDTCFASFASPLQTTTFSVMIESNGCTDEDALRILVNKNVDIYVPSGFSPNNDGENEVLTVYAGPQVAKIKSFLIFNRWGEPMYEFYNFQPNDVNFGWDGRHRGQLMNTGVYTWFVEVELIDGSEEIFKGTVTLVR